ncbi:MAG: CapA family protein [Oscillospiraceae bacterium]|nr:CapA family protein [Oscillospiraceae bacterium]
MAKTTFIATGDAFMTRRLPESGYPGFDRVREIIGGHEVRFNNLEFTAHDHEGYPAAFSGGTWAMVEPEVLDDLKQFGFNLYNTANNHSLDYSHGGLLATLKHMRARNMAAAGTGKNLFDASAPAYLDTPNARVAMLGMSSSFHDSDIAGNQSLNMDGRPGVNALRVSTTYTVEKKYYEMLKEVASATLMNAGQERMIHNGFSNPLPEGKLNFGGMSFVLGEVNERHTAPNQTDMARMEAQIREARRQADYVLVSIHSHQSPGLDTTEPDEFLVEFAHRCIDAGADAILGHGPHELRGIEIYRKKPIFYSLGNFIFQTDTTRLQPAEAYENKKMPAGSFPGELFDLRSKNGTQGYCVQENIWRSVMAGFTAEDGEITEIKLYPIDLNMGAKRSRIGWPSVPEDDAVLHYLARLSEPYGTKLEINGGLATIKVK